VKTLTVFGFFSCSKVLVLENISAKMCDPKIVKMNFKDRTDDLPKELDLETGQPKKECKRAKTWGSKTWKSFKKRIGVNKQKEIKIEATEGEIAPQCL